MYQYFKRQLKLRKVSDPLESILLEY